MHRHEKPDNLTALIEDSISKYPNNLLFGTKNSNGEYEWIDYKTVGHRIDNIRSGLSKIGVKKGDYVGIISKNRAEWAMIAFAVYGLGARYIPMYQKELPDIWKYIINDGGIKALFVPNPEIYEQIQSFRDQTPNLEHIYIIDGDGEDSLERLEKTGEQDPVPSIRPEPEDVAVLIYTSGTTGSPKGVLLTHGNFSSNFIAGGKCFPSLGPSSRSISILPWAHSFGQTAELYNMIHYGGSIGFMEDTTTLAEDMGKVKPTIMVAVPRVFNKIYDGLWAKMEAAGGIPKALFVMGIESAKKKRLLEENGGADFFTRLKYKIADRIVFKKIRERFGGRLELAISGSATMNVEIGHFFFDIGLPVYDCYGLSETSPAVTMNCPQAHKPGSVGRPIEHVRVAIDTSLSENGVDDGEIIVYGPNVMKGYHNRPEATREVMTEDGGFRTGDRGRLDDDGFLFITGRIKEQYKLENGKYIFPAAIEEEIKLIPWISSAMVYGDGKPYNVCLAVPDVDLLKKLTADKGVSSDPEATADSPEITRLIAEEITKSLKKKFRGYEIPRRFIVAGDDFSIENGMLTQTMKLKRRAVIDRYKDQLEELYHS